MSIEQTIKEFVLGTIDRAEAANAVRAALVEALAVATEKGVEIWNGLEGALVAAPAGGAVLRVDWANQDASYACWYPSRESAMAALHWLAARHGRVPQGNRLDLTSPGCHESSATVSWDAIVAPLPSDVLWTYVDRAGVRQKWTRGQQEAWLAQCQQVAEELDAQELRDGPSCLGAGD